VYASGTSDEPSFLRGLIDKAIAETDPEHFRKLLDQIEAVLRDMHRATRAEANTPA
jgi:hypothetical protein